MTSLLFGLISTPAQAAINGNITCSGGGFFRVTNNVVVPKTNDENNALVNKCKGTAVVPEGVTKIDEQGFNGETLMTDISLPNSLVEIKGNGFKSTGLRSINLPPNLVALAQGAFQDNPNMTTLVLPSSITNVGLFLAFGSNLLCDVYFLGSTAPTVNAQAFASICSSGSPNAWVPQGATGYPAINSNFGGLTVKNGGAILLFDGNGAESGNLPPTAFLTPGDVIRVAGNLGSLTRFGYKYIGYCTSKFDDGSGLCYKEGDVVTVPAGTTILYVNWQGKPKVTYESNGSTSGNVPVDSLSPYADNSNVIVLANGGGLARTGYTFTGWTRAIDGSGTLLLTGDIFDIGTTDAKLYAKWEAASNAVTYNSKGGSAVTQGSFFTGGSIASAPTEPKLSGYGFVGWSATDGGSAITFPYTPAAITGITLYAKWQVAYAVTYDSKSGSNVTPGSFFAAGSIASAPDVPNLSGYRFIGWSATDGGDLITFPYTPGVTAGITLYALWEALPISSPSTTPTTTPSTTPTLFELPLGQSSAEIDGQPVQVTVKKISESGISASIPEVLSVSFMAIAENLSTLSVANDGSLILNRSGFIEFAGQGLGAGTTAQVWLRSDPVLLGTVEVDNAGNFTGSFKLPSGIPVGNHTLNLVGVSPNGGKVSLGLGVKLLGKTSATRNKNVLQFAFGTSELTQTDKAKIRKVVSKAGKSAYFSLICGVGDIKSVPTADEKRLATKRCKVVRKYVIKLGVKKSHVSYSLLTYAIGVTPKTKILTSILPTS